MAGKPAYLLMMQPGQYADYIHLRAIMATVQPAIMRKTSALRQQIAAQSELEAQEVSALKSLRDARGRLTNRQSALAAWEGDVLGNNAAMSANAAIAFEQAIAQGERARDIIGRIDNQRLSATKAAELAALDGPFIRPGHSEQGRSRSSAYILPAAGRYRSYGNIVIIEHGKGWNSLITNLHSVEVTKGQKLIKAPYLGAPEKTHLKLALSCAKIAA